jgi:hypothetical protein
VCKDSKGLCIRRGNLKYLEGKIVDAKLKKISTQICTVISRFIQFNQIVDCVYNKIAKNNLVDGFYIRSRANKFGKKSD